MDLLWSVASFQGDSESDQTFPNWAEKPEIPGGLNSDPLEF